MEQGTTAKLCECGCGRPAPIAKETNSRLGYVKGQAKRFVHGHSGGSRATLSVKVGQRFGRGVVIEAETRIQVSEHGSARAARLLCDCGKEYLARIQHLVSGKGDPSGSVRSCGCLLRERIDRAGQRYGKLVIAEYAGRRGKDRSTLWLCRCDCGNKVITAGKTLLSGEITSCGCARRKPRDPGAPQQAARNLILRGYRRHALDRGLTWALSGDDFDRLTSQDCHYCGQSPSTVSRSGLYEGGVFTYNGIDRVDNSLGYVAGNVVTCCKICNNAKKDLPLEDFMAWIARLTEYHWFHPDVMPSRLLRRSA